MSRAVALGNSLVWSVSGVVKEERRILVGFPLDQIGWSQIGGLVGAKRASRGASATTAAMSADKSVPSVASDFDVALEKVVALRAAGFSAVFRADHDFLCSEDIAELAKLKGLALEHKLGFET